MSANKIFMVAHEALGYKRIVSFSSEKLKDTFKKRLEDSAIKVQDLTKFQAMCILAENSRPTVPESGWLSHVHY